MKTIKTLLLAAIVLCAGLKAFIYSGSYPVGADVPHTAFTNWALETLRNRSIERASGDTQVPSLDDPDLLLSGGPD